MSPIFLRIWYQTSGTSFEGVDSSRVMVICETPGLEKLVM